MPELCTSLRSTKPVNKCLACCSISSASWTGSIRYTVKQRSLLPSPFDWSFQATSVQACDGRPGLVATCLLTRGPIAESVALALSCNNVTDQFACTAAPVRIVHASARPNMPHQVHLILVKVDLSTFRGV